VSSPETSSINLELGRQVANLSCSGRLTEAAMKVYDHCTTRETAVAFLEGLERKYFSNEHVYKELYDLVMAISD
jgi:hypothetical protein